MFMICRAGLPRPATLIYTYNNQWIENLQLQICILQYNSCGATINHKLLTTDRCYFPSHSLKSFTLFLLTIISLSGRGEI